MDRIAIPHEGNREYKKPSWQREGQGIWVRCSNGHLAPISEHKVDNNGKVSPSLVCPIIGCGFHKKVKLEGFGSAGGEF